MSLIAGQAMLFRDEGDVVVQFRPAFDFELRETSVGMKLMPSLEPHWAVLREHRGALTDAIAAAIRAAPTREHEVGTSRRQRSVATQRRNGRNSDDDAIVDARSSFGGTAARAPPGAVSGRDMA